MGHTAYKATVVDKNVSSLHKEAKLLTMKNTRRVFVFNIIMTIIGYSWGLKCFTKTVYTNNEGKEIIVGSDGQVGSDGKSVECEAGENFCVTLSGSFNVGSNPYEVESIRKCADKCDETSTFGPNELADTLELVDRNLEFMQDTTAGSTPVTRECCVAENCNKPQGTTSTGYSIHKVSFNIIVLLIAVSAISFFYTARTFQLL